MAGDAASGRPRDDRVGHVDRRPDHGHHTQHGVARTRMRWKQTMNTTGSDVLAAQVGGIGIAPGANLSDAVAVFEATHGTAPKYAGTDYVDPGSLSLSAEMMLRHIGWTLAADYLLQAMERAIASMREDLRLRAPDGRRHAGEHL